MHLHISYMPVAREKFHIRPPDQTTHHTYATSYAESSPETSHTNRPSLPPITTQETTPTPPRYPSSSEIPLSSPRSQRGAAVPRLESRRSASLNLVLNRFLAVSFSLPSPTDWRLLARFAVRNRRSAAMRSSGVASRMRRTLRVWWRYEDRPLR